MKVLLLQQQDSTLWQSAVVLEAVGGLSWSSAEFLSCCLQKETNLW